MKEITRGLWKEFAIHTAMQPRETDYSLSRGTLYKRRAGTNERVPMSMCERCEEPHGETVWVNEDLSLALCRRCAGQEEDADVEAAAALGITL
jgi:hypothetical protein